MSASVGSIIIINNPTQPSYSKTKTAVVVAVGPTTVVLVNTESREQYECVRIAAADHSYLGQDRYIGCRNQFEITSESIIEVKGHATADDLVRILDKMKASRSLSGMKKQKFEKSIQPEIDRLLALASAAKHKIEDH